jgi:hypothetical protein
MNPVKPQETALLTSERKNASIENEWVTESALLNFRAP